jgi:RecB family exonuclease
MAHALLGPSSAARWIACPPSVKLCEQFEDVESEYAKEGSLAHEIAELKVRKLIDPGLTSRKFTTSMKKLKDKELYQEEMQGYTDEYVEFIQEQMYSYSTTPHTAVEQKVDFSQYVPDGFGTADCILIADDTLHIIDFKYGKGVPVNVENNAQLLLYALGAYLAYEMIFPITHIKMSIVQPRLAIIDTWECRLDYLLEFAKIAQEKAAMALKGEGDFNCGEHCTFCKAKAVCRERANANLELAKYEFKAADQLTLEEIGQILEKAKDLAKWADDLKDYALSESLKGNEVPGWKAVKGRGSRSFTNTDEAIKVLVDNGIAEELLFERKYLTLAQMEKTVGKKEFNNLVGDLIAMNVGKPTLVEASDKREAITNKIKAEDEFSVVEDINSL